MLSLQAWTYRTNGSDKMVEGAEKFRFKWKIQFSHSLCLLSSSRPDLSLLSFDIHQAALLHHSTESTVENKVFYGLANAKETFGQIAGKIFDGGWRSRPALVDIIDVGSCR